MPLTLVLGPANSAKAGEVLGAYALAARRDALLVVPTAADVAHYERELAALGRHARPGAHLSRADRGDRGARARLPRRAADARCSASACCAARSHRCSSSACWPARRRAAGFARAAGRLIAELEQRRVDPAAVRRGTASVGRRATAARVRYARELAAIYRALSRRARASSAASTPSCSPGARSMRCARARPLGRDAGVPLRLRRPDRRSSSTRSRRCRARRSAASTVSLTYEPGRPALAARATVVEELRAIAQARHASCRRSTSTTRRRARAALHHLERRLFEPARPVSIPATRSR